MIRRLRGSRLNVHRMLGAAWAPEAAGDGKLGVISVGIELLKTKIIQFKGLFIDTFSER